MNASMTATARSSLTAMLQEDPQRLRRRSISLGVHPDDADDVAQNAALRAWRSVDALRSSDPGSMCAWLDAIARTAAADLGRRRRAERSDGEVQCESLTAFQRVEESVELRDRLAATVAAIRDLPDALREPLLLNVVDELSAPEVAERLGITAAAVRQRIARARRALAR